MTTRRLLRTAAAGLVLALATAGCSTTATQGTKTQADNSRADNSQAATPATTTAMRASRRRRYRSASGAPRREGLPRRSPSTSNLSSSRR